VETNAVVVALILTGNRIAGSLELLYDLGIRGGDMVFIGN
jgi:hypothetical protein